MKKKNRVIAIAVALGMVFSTTIQTGYVEAKAKPKLSRKKVTVYVGKSATVSVKKAKGYKVKWKATVKSVVKLKKKGKFSVKITAKKAGTTKVKACLTKKRSKKTLSCKVVVKKKNDSQQNATPAPSKVPVNAQNNIVKLVLTKAAATSYTLSGDMNNVEFYNDGLIYSSKPKNSQMAGSVYDNGCGFYLNAGKKVVNLKTLGFKYIALRVKTDVEADKINLLTCSNPSVKDSEKYSDRRDNWNKAIKITDDKSGMKILYYDVNDIYDNPALATTVGFSVVSSKSGDINTFEEKKVVVYGIYALKAEKELDARPSTTPSVTQPPAATNEPGATEVPTVTNEPGATEVPAATNEPGATEVPTVTNEPGATEVPTATNEPGATEVPTVTNEPGVTEVPTVTNEPGVTEVPTVTSKPTAPPTATPTAPPTATPTATPTAPPEETKDYIYVINNPKGQTASEDNGEPGGQHISVDLTPSLPKDDITKYKELRVYYELYRDTDENTKAPFSGMGLVSSVYANVQAHDLIDEEGDEFLSDEVATIYGKDDNIGRDDRTPLYSSLDISSFTKKPNHLFWVLTNSVKMEEYEYIKVIVTKVEYIAK